MTEKIPLNKLNGQKIYRSVVKGNMTLRQLAEGYECPFEQFIAECKRIVGQFEWPRIERADKKNQKKGDRKEDTSMAITKKNPNGIGKKKRFIQSEMACVKEKLGISQKVLEDFTQRAINAQKDEELALKLYQDAVKRREWAEENRNTANTQVQNYQNRIEQLRSKLEELEVYLVAPGYKGKLPAGKLVAIAPIEGHNVTVEHGDELLNEISFNMAKSLGFETFKEASMALEFAKLVIKYQVEGEEEYHVLVDDEKILAILHGQEVEI